MSGLYLKSICKSFGETKVLKDISLELEAGEFLVLLGPSGCGKSTCLRLIAGLESPDSGEIYINSKRVEQLPPKKRDVAMVFQNYSLYPHMTVRKNLAFPLKIAHFPADKIAETVERAAATLGLTDKLESRPGQLSGGQRQRVALGRAIVRKPSIFLLDEPLSNLDADLRVRMRREIVRIQREMGCTAVYVTHDQSEALTMADRIVLLNEGEIVQVGTPEELYRNPATLFAARFVGHPRINIIEAVVNEGLTAPLGLKVDSQSSPDGSSCLIGIRPESVRVDSSGDFHATVIGSEYAGGHYLTTLDLKGNRINGAPGDKQYEISREVRFSIDPVEVLIFDPVTGKRINRV
ncbi:MAG: ABC transporter ATP-binding protein [bacterium]|nr:ABC transporter ATP-binding protein [bacterium]